MSNSVMVEKKKTNWHMLCLLRQGEKNDAAVMVEDSDGIRHRVIGHTLTTTDCIVSTDTDRFLSLDKDVMNVYFA